MVERIKQELDTVNLTQQAFEMFGAVNSLNETISAVKQFPFMIQDEFIVAVVDFIQKEVSALQKPAFEQRLALLRTIANTQK